MIRFSGGRCLGQGRTEGCYRASTLMRTSDRSGRMRDGTTKNTVVVNEEYYEIHQ